MNIYFSLLFILLFVFSILLSIEDIKNYEITNWKLISGGILTLFVHIIFVKFEVIYYLISCLINFMILLFVRKISKNKLGLGDVYFGIFQGLFLKPEWLWLCLALETLFSFIRFKIINIKGKVAFIPYMSCGVILTFTISVIIQLITK